MRKKEDLLKKAEEDVEKEVKKEERFIFHKFIYLKKHHQILFGLLLVVGLVFIWRGLWHLMDAFWFPSLRYISEITGIVFGLLILFLSHRLMIILTGKD